MEKIKTYQEVVPSNNAVSFEIKRMEEIYELMKGKPDDPHRHDYYIVLIVKKAKGKHIIDFNEFDLSGNQLYFVSPGQVHQIIEEEQSFGYAITFSQQFLAFNYIEESFVKSLFLFQENGFSPPLEMDEESMQQASEMAEKMLAKNAENGKWKYEGLGAWLKLLLILAHESCNLFPEKHTQIIQAGNVLLKEFKDLLDEKYSTWHKVGEYASALNVSADYLSASINNLTGKTVKGHIQNRILLAAKRMLLFSDFTNKEIAYELGFSEPANFSQFFKKMVKQSPTSFQKEYSS
ncbi:MAG: helix-turn-helix transcriptional regulator [Saprospiraceae bacterium]|nr:helix-turn-helix transcriptional regulator [Saprospiraceae bacterium]